MKLLPFYMIGNNIFIDAHFLSSISKPYIRILLVRSNLKLEQEGEKLEPIPLDHVIKLLEDGYVDLKSLSEKKERLDSLDYLLSSLYNPGWYFRKREAEITSSSLLRIYDLAYKLVLKKLRDLSRVDVVFVSISFSNDSILINGKEDRIYTTLFKSDSNFKKAILNSLSG
ncbi:hypothetical protein SULI_02390 [Saccharolobus solfataricus]|nr:hypothetical protein [Saccharolobus solfataricus]AKA72876.1 hypothetical protein SULB_0470 [Saccharolobus solfataricus]AKA75575.1 hypothetical protein SULC_0468 [Saccharolobus solfataricus]AKA78268.1 hypothetical protein SULA_0468 [Saccharolobus solfataricus]AZF67386.1 hypothetical protein SULG_02390 [Saccharolobus solfataricus]AZF70006.1 hypothetical protein SULH_02390 [Saccharolobus solfataricus]